MTLDLSLNNAQFEAAITRAHNDSKSVLDYGADPTGAASSTAAFNAAISDNVGKTVRVPAGTYLLTEGATTGTCVSIMNSISLVLDPGAVLKLGTATAVPAIMIGDEATAFSNVTIVGGRLDGDASNSTITAKVRTSLLEIRGPVTDVLVADMFIGNAKLGAVESHGTDTNNRAKRVFFERCHVSNVTEGVVFENTDEFHWRGGNITGMTSQDCFEPHGGLNGWSLRDCTISSADATNSEIEIFPQAGDILNGVIENVRVKGELRISVSAPATYEVSNLTIRNVTFENGLIYAGADDGRFRGVEVTNCEFIGPATNVPRSVPHVNGAKAGIHAAGVSTNRMNIRNSRFHDYDASGILIDCPEAQVTNNVFYNNGQSVALAGYQRCGLRVSGADALVAGNHAYDNQTTKTQIFTPQLVGAGVRIIGNLFEDADTVTRNLSTGWVSVANRGEFQDVSDALVTMPAGQSWVNVDLTKFPGLMSSTSSAFGAAKRTLVTPLSDMSPAKSFRTYVGGGNFRIYTDVAPTNAVTFHVQAIVNCEQVDATA